MGVLLKVCMVIYGPGLEREKIRKLSSNNTFVLRRKRNTLHPYFGDAIYQKCSCHIIKSAKR